MTFSNLRMKMGAINAMRLPREMSADLPDPSSMATPVNNWRIILGAVSGSAMQMLPHRSYVYPTDDHIYQFCDVTGLLADSERSDAGPAATAGSRRPMQADGVETNEGDLARGPPLSSMLPDCGPYPTNGVGVP